MIFYEIFFFLVNNVFYINVKWFIGIDIIVIVFNSEVIIGKKFKLDI